MPDIADDHAAYREALLRAEGDAGISRDSDGNEVYADGETPVVTPELVEAVPVSASDQPLDTEPAVTETGDEPPVEVDTSEQQETLFAGKYKSLEDLEKAHVELQQKLGDPNRLDLENRRLQEQLDALSAKIDEAQTVTPQAPAIQITQELIDNDPQRATLLAFEQKNQGALEIAFAQWKDEDPFTASQWLTDQRLAEQSKALDAKLAKVQEETDKKTAPLAEQQAKEQENAAWKYAFDTAKLGRPDLIENAERLILEVAPLYPSYANWLSNGDAQQKTDALIALYNADKLGSPETLAQELGEKATEAANEAAAALAAGAVVSGQSTTGQTTVEKSDEELEADRYIARQRSKPSLTTGWTGRKDS